MNNLPKLAQVKSDGAGILTSESMVLHDYVREQGYISNSLTLNKSLNVNNSV